MIGIIVHQIITGIMYLLIAAGLGLSIYVIFASFNPKSMWYEGDKIVGGWEKEEAKKAKAEAKRRKKRKWYQW